MFVNAKEKGDNDRKMKRRGCKLIRTGAVYQDPERESPG